MRQFQTLNEKQSRYVKYESGINDFFLVKYHQQQRRRYTNIQIIKNNMNYQHINFQEYMAQYMQAFMSANTRIPQQPNQQAPVPMMVYGHPQYYYPFQYPMQNPVPMQYSPQPPNPPTCKKEEATQVVPEPKIETAIERPRVRPRPVESKSNSPNTSKKISKNIPKNIFKGIVKYILGKKTDLEQYLEEEEVTKFLQFIRRSKNTVLTQHQLKQFLQGKENDRYSRVIRLLRYFQYEKQSQLSLLQERLRRLHLQFQDQMQARTPLLQNQVYSNDGATRLKLDLDKPYKIEQFKNVSTCGSLLRQTFEQKQCPADSPTSLRHKIRETLNTEQNINNLHMLFFTKRPIKELSVEVVRSTHRSRVLEQYRSFLKVLPTLFQRNLQRQQKLKEVRWIYEEGKSEQCPETIAFLIETGDVVLQRIAKGEYPPFPQLYVNPLHNQGLLRNQLDLRFISQPRY